MTDASNLPDNVVEFVHSGVTPTPPAGGKGRAQGKPKKPKKPIDWGQLDQLTEQYALIYGSDTVFDLIHRRIIKVNAVRLAHGADKRYAFHDLPSGRVLSNESATLPRSAASCTALMALSLARSYMSCSSAHTSGV